MVKSFAFLAILGCLALLIPSCGGAPSTETTASPTPSSPATSKPTPTKTPEIVTEGARRFSLGQPFEYSNATFTFKGAETMEKIPVYLEENFYTPKNGKYLWFTFPLKATNRMTRRA